MAAVLYNMAEIRRFLETNNIIKYGAFLRRDKLFDLPDWKAVVPNLMDWTMLDDPDDQSVVEPGAPIAFDDSGIPSRTEIPGVNRLQIENSHGQDLVLQTYTDVCASFTRFGFAIWRDNSLFRCSSATPRFSPADQPTAAVEVDRLLYIGDMTKTDNICHFTFDYLARAFMAKQLLGWHDSEILFPIMSNDYQRHMKARTFPFAPEYLENTVYKVRNLCLFADSSHRLDHPARHCDPRILSALRRSVLGELATPDQAAGKFYLSRRDARNLRPLLNEPELEEMLAGLGYAIVQMSKFSPVEQVAMMAGARSIVAPHGAALTSIVFCPPGARVVEIMNPTIGTLCYFKIAQKVGLDYRMVVAEPCDAPGSMRVSLREIADLCALPLPNANPAPQLA